jgi:hypothetical protein
MRFNFTFVGQFIGGIACLVLAYLIITGGSSGGFLFKARGMEAQIKAFLLAGLGVYLCLLPFRIPPEKSVRWNVIFLMFGLVFSTEVLTHLFAGVLQ